MKTWNVGNTTVRNPERLREALQLFLDKMGGRPFRKQEQIEFQGHMIDAGLVDSVRRGGDDGARKFASAFKQLGFVTDWSRGKDWHLTAVGEALIQNPNIESSIFLRQLLKYQLPSPLEMAAGFQIHPFRLFLQFLKRAHDEGLIGLTKYEIGLFVITTLDEKDFAKSFAKIRSFRDKYEKNIGKVLKVRFINKQMETLASQLGLTSQTFLDYADSSSRYFLMSGLLTLRGNKIAISESRLPFIETLLQDEVVFESDSTYLDHFYNAEWPTLPSDQPEFLTVEIEKLSNQIQQLASGNDEPTLIPTGPIPTTLLKMQEYEQALRNELRRIREIDFYRKQSSSDALEEIEMYLESIRDGNLFGGQLYAPAYFEWAVWRLFLAINHIVGAVSKTRGFRIDEDMQPIHHARGGAADLRFTYADFVLVCEMTLATSSRQFAMEGEPVTRHVYMAIKEQDGGKPVYGLFVAKEIDPNTVDAFYNARYWTNWKTHVATPVVALNIEHMLLLVQHIKKTPIPINQLRNVLEHILSIQPKYTNGPNWYEGYSKNFQSFLIV